LHSHIIEYKSMDEIFKQEKIIVKGHCPTCKDDRNAYLIAEHLEKWEDKDAPIWSTVKYQILKCCGCDSVYFKEEHYFSEDEEYSYGSNGETLIEVKPTCSYWPQPLRRKPAEWLDRYCALDAEVANLLRQIYSALNNDLNILAAMGMRTLFDKTCEVLKINSSITFQQKLDKLVSEKLVGEMEKEIFEVLTDAGSAAAHRGWQPSLSDIDVLMTAMEQFLYRAFILKWEAQKVKSRIPPRHSRGA
jgi:hypothetical protein